MQSIKFNEANLVLKAPADWDEENLGPCSDLFVHNTGVTLNSLWVPNEEELEILKNGGGVVLSIFGRGHPAVSLTVANITYEEAQEEPAHGAEPAEEGETYDDISQDGPTSN